MLRKIFIILFCFLFSSNVYAVEFYGNFIQGHFIVGKTNPNSKVVIDKKIVKVSKDGFFVFGLDRDRKYDVIIKIKNSHKHK